MRSLLCFNAVDIVNPISKEVIMLPFIYSFNALFINTFMLIRVAIKMEILSPIQIGKCILDRA